MDKITKVQEVSSFIVNFDNKYWNEVILRLTIIGIRYVTNNYKDIFSWKLKDLNLIIDNLEKINRPKSPKTFNNNKSTNKKKESKKDYNNNNKNNSNTLKTKEKKNNNNSPLNKSKKSVNKNNNNMDKNENLSNNNINNNMLLLSERNGKENNRYNQKIKKSKGENIYLKNCNSNRNKIMSLKQNSFNENNNSKNINVIVSNFPFHKNNINNNNDDSGFINRDKFIKNKNDFVFDFNQEQSDYLINKMKNRIGNIGYNNRNNYSYFPEKLYNTNIEYIPVNKYEEKNINKNFKFLNDLTLIKKYDYKNNCQEFISELRKINHSKEYNKNKKNPKNIISNIIYHSQPKINKSYSSRSFECKNKNLPFKSYCIQNNNLSFKSVSSKEKIEKNEKINSDKLIFINKENRDKDKENILLRNINRKYNFNETNDNLETNFQYGINNNNNISNKENIPIRLNNNKYLKNPIQNMEKIKTNFITDISKKKKYKMNFEYTSINKENNNSFNLENNYFKKPPNTDRYSCNYLYEIQPQKTKNDNTESFIKNNLEDEYKSKENNANKK